MSAAATAPQPAWWQLNNNNASTAKHEKQNFFDSFDCRSGSHCRICRSRTEGVAFRASIAVYFAVHADHAGEPPDWDCPHGRPWGFNEIAKPIPCSSQMTAAATIQSESPSRLGDDCSEARLAFIRQTCFVCKSTGPGCRFGTLTSCRQRKLLHRFSNLRCSVKPSKW